MEFISFKFGLVYSMYPKTNACLHYHLDKPKLNTKHILMRILMFKMLRSHCLLLT